MEDKYNCIILGYFSGNEPAELSLVMTRADAEEQLRQLRFFHPGGNFWIEELTDEQSKRLEAAWDMFTPSAEANVMQ
jgi:hypothetical protein